MTPFMGLIIVIWSAASPALPHPQPNEVWREVFPDQQICEIALAEALADVRGTYENARRKPANIIADCLPATGKNI